MIEDLVDEEILETGIISNSGIEYDIILRPQSQDEVKIVALDLEANELGFCVLDNDRERDPKQFLHLPDTEAPRFTSYFESHIRREGVATQLLHTLFSLLRKHGGMHVEGFNQNGRAALLPKYLLAGYTPTNIMGGVTPPGWARLQTDWIYKEY